MYKQHKFILEQNENVSKQVCFTVQVSLGVQAAKQSEACCVSPLLFLLPLLFQGHLGLLFNLFKGYRLTYATNVCTTSGVYINSGVTAVIFKCS